MKPHPKIPVLVVFFVLVAGCAPDPRSIRGAIAYAREAIEADDSRRLFRVIDERARHAMVSIVSDRRKAAEEIRSGYPEPLQAAALAELGDAAHAESPEELFAMRCTEPCRAELGAKLGAPEHERQDGEERVVLTAGGSEIRLFRSDEGSWWGLVWKVDDLAWERSRANRDLKTIRENVATYARRRALEGP